MTAAEVEPTEPAVPFATGTYALFETPGGGVHLSLREASGTEHHIEAPAFMVQLMKDGGNLSPMAVLKSLRKHGK